MNELKFTQMVGILFAELAPLLCLFPVFGNVTVKFLPSRGGVISPHLKLGWTYEI